MARTLMGKTRPKDDPYLRFDGGPFGPAFVLKGYTADESQPYARWFVYCNGDLGDTYVSDLMTYSVCTYIDPVLTEAGYQLPTSWSSPGF